MNEDTQAEVEDTLLCKCHICGGDDLINFVINDANIDLIDDEIGQDFFVSKIWQAVFCPVCKISWAVATWANDSDS